MTENKCKKMCLVACATLIMALGSVFRVLLWNEPVWSEVASRAAAVFLACTGIVLSKRVSIKNLLSCKPIAVAAVLYALGGCLIVLERLFPASPEMIGFWAAVPFALAVVPVLYSQRGVGLSGVFVSTFAAIPAYALLILCQSVAGVVVLAAVHFGLLSSACWMEWFDYEDIVSVFSVYAVISVSLLIWILLFDGGGFWADAILNRIDPAGVWSTVGYWDYVTRNVLLHAQPVQIPAVDLPLYIPIGQPYLLAQALLSLGWIPALIPSLLLLVLGGKLFFSREERNVPFFWGKGAALCLAVPIFFSLSQNFGCHIVYVDIPFFSGDVIGTAVSFLLLWLWGEKREPPLPVWVENPVAGEAVLFSVDYAQLPNRLIAIYFKMGHSIDGADGFSKEEIDNMLEGRTGCIMLLYQGSRAEVLRELQQTVFRTEKVLAAWFEISDRASKREEDALVSALEDTILFDQDQMYLKVSKRKSFRRNETVLTILLS